MNAFYKALEQGHSPEEIIKYISKAIPQAAEPIRKASKAGYTIQQILGFLSKNFDTENRRGMSETERHAANRRSDAAMTKYGLKMAGSAVVAPIAGIAARNALSRALPSSLQSVAQQLLPTNIQSSSNESNPLQSASAPTSQMPQVTGQSENVSQQPPVNEPTIPQPSQAVQPEGISTNISEILTKQNSKEKVDDLIRAGNGPKEIMAYFRKFHPKIEKDIEKQSGMPFEKAIEEYAKTAQQKIQEQKVPDLGSMGKAISENLYKGIFESLKKGEDTFSGVKDPLLQAAKPAFEAGQIKSPEDLKKFAEFWEKSKKEKPTLEKNSTVATPNGIGEVKEIRNGKALVEVDGKLHKVNEEELEAEPKDIADLYDDLFNAIPEQYKSRMMNFAGYDEENNELLFRPHGGAAYVYKDIPPEFAEDLKNKLHRAKTTGKNMYGMWYEGDQSYGAGMSALIKKLQAQYGGKGKEYIRKYNTLFDILGIPHEEKKRKEQEERRRRKGIS